MLFVRQLSAIALCALVTGAAAAEEAQRLTRVRDIYPNWSPDGRWIVFHSNRSGPVSQIFKLELGTGEVTQLTSGPGDKRTASFSPDGRRIAFHLEPGDELEGDIFVMNADGSELTNVTGDAAIDGHPTWVSNDLILYDSTRDDEGTSEIANKELYTLSLATGEVTRVTHYDDWDTFGSVSPDGSRIVWRRITRNDDGSRNAEIFVMNRDGSDPRNLSRHPAFDAYPNWSPDGRRVLFSSNRDAVNYEDFNLFLIDPTGENLEQLTRTIAHVEQIRPRFSPDGESIVFNLQYLDGRIEMQVMDSATPTPETELLRLHRKGLEAHLASDIEALLEDESDDDYVVVGRGVMSQPSKQERRERLGPYLAATRFELYEDQVEPVVRVSEDGSLGWVTVQVHARGVQTGDDGVARDLEFVSGWIELYARQDGRWLRIGNVSNFQP